MIHLLEPKILCYCREQEFLEREIPDVWKVPLDTVGSGLEFVGICVLCGREVKVKFPSSSK